MIIFATFSNFFVELLIFYKNYTIIIHSENVFKGVFGVFYSAELDFLCRVLRNFSVNTSFIVEDEPLPQEIDKGLRKFLELDEDYKKQFDLSAALKPNTLYTFTDDFLCSYIFILLPSTEKKTVFAAGPYLKSEITRDAILAFAEKYGIPFRLVSQVIRYFGNIPCIKEDTTLMNLFFSFCELIWGSENSFDVTEADFTGAGKFEVDSFRSFRSKSEDPLLSVRILEEKYKTESEMIQAVSQGAIHKVEKLFINPSVFVFEKRSNDQLRNIKEHLIIQNTLLRKAAEYGSVHPFHIDGLSSEFTKEIEKVRNINDANSLFQEMARKYCLLVKKHSMKNYSLLVQKVLTVIDADLTADLGLKHLAEMININASYLSALFKKETGRTLTDYVTQKRVDHAAFLLRSTNLQIQSVAQQCGVFDVNYFAKIFKKYMGKSPKEYREEI